MLLLQVFRLNLSMCRHYGTFIREELLMKVDTLMAEVQVQMEDAVDAYGSRQQEEVWVQGKFTSNANLKPQVTMSRSSNCQ
jgi:hypothetical protein